MTREKQIAMALAKLKTAQRYLREAEREVRIATRPEKPKAEGSQG